MALQILYFVPYNLLQPATSFSAISQKLLVSPVLKKLVFLNSSEEVCHLICPSKILSERNVARHVSSCCVIAESRYLFQFALTADTLYAG